MRLPGMLHGKIFRSTVAHGRIASIDTDAAKAVPGVYRVVTSEDVRKVIPEPYYGPAFHDQPILAIDKVHYVGEPVAVVLAADPHVAEEAAQLIVAEYEELSPADDRIWHDEIAAMRRDLRLWVDEIARAGGEWVPIKFEWVFGYSQHFGLHSVDRATFRRAPKPSAAALSAIVRRNAV